MRPPRADVVRPDAVVGGFRVEKKLGAGGFGQVYLAWRDGGPCALKFLHLASTGDWGWRELLILMSHELPQVVKLRGHFKWPEATPEYLVLIMEYVPGRTLYDWAHAHNPSARELVALLLPLARALRAVHAAGVLHRDLKGDNVLVREDDGLPVLVDFGVGTLPNAPAVTQEALAPANLHYRSPEAVRFLLHARRGERYVYGVKDELYSLGVLLYVLLTDGYPFDGPAPELVGEILEGAPLPPRESNPRVPVPLSELCLRLLDLDPTVRPSSAEALCGALEALLAVAGEDPRWALPLFYGWTDEGRTTEKVPELVVQDPHAGVTRWFRRQPRRGPKPPAALPPSILEPAPVPRPRVRWRALVRWVGVGLAVSMGLVLGPSRMAEPVPVEVSWSGPTSWGMSVHEVAPPWGPPEADAGAAPSRADTPAPVTRVVTLSSGTTRMKKKAPKPQVRKNEGSPQARALLAVTAASCMACSTVQVRKAPAPEACPEGSVETMKQTFGWYIGGRDMEVAFPGSNDHNVNFVSLREGSITVRQRGHWNMGSGSAYHSGRVVLPYGTLLSGRLFFGEKLVYGRITQAVTPEGDTYAVCMELWDKDNHRGVNIESERDGVVMTYPRVNVTTVDHFE